MDEMDGRHGARRAKQFKCLDDGKKLNRWEQFPRNGWKRSGSLWTTIAKELLGSFGDINQNHSGEASADPRRGAQILSDGKLHPPPL